MARVMVQQTQTSQKYKGRKKRELSLKGGGGWGGWEPALAKNRT